MSAFIKYSKLSVLVSLFLSLFIVAGCSEVRIIGPYDEVVDEGIMAFHTDVTAFVGKMVAAAGKPEGTYEANKGTYPELAASLSSLSMRAAQSPKNDLTVRALAELTGNVERLRALHVSAGEQGLGQPLAGPALAALDIQCRSIMKLEIAKKRGDAN